MSEKTDAAEARAEAAADARAANLPPGLRPANPTNIAAGVQVLPDPVGKETIRVFKGGVDVTKGVSHAAGRLNLAAMQEAIRRKGSVLYKGRLITTAAELPGLEQLAETTEQKTQARKALEAERQAIENRLKTLDAEDRTAVAAAKK